MHNSWAAKLFPAKIFPGSQWLQLQKLGLHTLYIPVAVAVANQLPNSKMDAVANDGAYVLRAPLRNVAVADFLPYVPELARVYKCYGIGFATATTIATHFELAAFPFATATATL